MDSAKQRITALSLTHQILSPYTAFVGVQKTMNRNDATAPPQIRHVPIQITKGDEHLFSHYSWSNSASKIISNIILTITTMTIL